MRRIGAIVNPNSGQGLGGRLERWLKLRLGEELDLLELAPGVDIPEWARHEVSLGCERILAFGGDGTFRAVAEALLGIDVRLGLVATGTNNNIARALGLPPDPHEATEIALTGSSEWISAGRINGYFFLEGAGIGLEAELWPVGEAVVRRRFREVLEGPLALARTIPAAVEIDLEDPDFHETVSAYTMTISNVAVTGAHLPLAPDADIRDPQLYLNVYRSLGPMGTLRTGFDLARKRAVRPEFVSRHPFMRGRISGSEPLNVHADGSLIGTLPVEVESIPNAIRVVVPEPSDRRATAAAVTGAHLGPEASTVMGAN
jgi:diacylglycerol kinase family enzyme